MNFTTLLYQVNENICLITINRPDKLNALNKTVFTELEQAIDAASTDAAVKSIIITGAGPKAFVAGADISEFSALSKEEAIALSQRGQDIFFKIENCTKPVVAAINGFALGGGCELAMACHFRLCSDNAKFGQPEASLGLIPGYGGTQRLTQLIGKGKSMELQMSAQMINASEALQLGLVNYVCSSNDLLNKTKEILTTINSKAPIAISKIIACVNMAGNTTENGFRFEANSFGSCFDSADAKEGAAAFLEKRKPVFTGK